MPTCQVKYPASLFSLGLFPVNEVEHLSQVYWPFTCFANPLLPSPVSHWIVGLLLIYKGSWRMTEVTFVTDAECLSLVLLSFEIVYIFPLSQRFLSA